MARLKTTLSSKKELLIIYCLVFFFLHHTLHSLDNKFRISLSLLETKRLPKLRFLSEEVLNYGGARWEISAQKSVRPLRLEARVSKLSITQPESCFIHKHKYLHFSKVSGGGLCCKRQYFNPLNTELNPICQ